MAEFIYALLMLCGMIKFFIMFNAPGLAVVDFTVLTAGAMSVLLLLKAFKNFFFESKFYAAKGSFPAIFFLLSFFGWMVFSLIYTESTGYASIKTYLFITTILAFIFPLLYQDFDPKKFFRYLVFFGTVFLLLYIATMPESYAYTSTEEKAFLDKYLDVGFLAALNILVLLFLKLDIKTSIKTALIGANMVSTMLAGARGPILILVVVVLLKLFLNSKQWLVYFKRISFKQIFVILLALVVLAGGLVYAAQKYSESVDRTLYRLSLVVDAGSNSVAARITYIDFSLEKMFKDVKRVFIGYGIGSFGKVYSGEDKRLYPHNIVLEVWFELGLIGLLLIAAFFVLCLRKIKRGGIFFVFLYLFLNSLKSSSLVDLRIMFGLLAVFWVMAIRNTEQEA